MLLDAHGSGESAALVLTTVEAEAPTLMACLEEAIETAFVSLQRHLLALFQSPAFRDACQRVRGETACLICARKERFVWWLSVGDCVAYLFHPELAALGQFALNQRSFYEWIGRASSLDLPAPCFAAGVRELRGGRSAIVMTTDGLLECGTRLFADPRRLYDQVALRDTGGEVDMEQRLRAALTRVHEDRGRDSATVIAWGCVTDQVGLMPST